MAGVSTKEIKNRIRSMESTKQITKAMEWWLPPSSAVPRRR